MRKNCHIILQTNISTDILTLFRMGLFGACRRSGGGGGVQKGLLPKICHTYPKKMKLGSYFLAKEDSKNI